MTQLIVTVIMIVIVLYILKSGWLLQFLDNVPFIDNVAGAVKGLMGLSAGMPQQPAGKFFFDELVKSLVFLCIFAVVSKVAHSFLQIGKHEEATDFSRLLAKPLEWLAANFFSAVFTGLVMEAIDGYIARALQVSRLLVAGLSVLTAGLLIFAAFRLLGKELTAFAVHLSVGLVLPTVVKLIAVEFVIIFLYFMLNVPGVFDAAGTVIIMLAGILCCLGSIVGAEVLGNRFQ